MGAGLLTLCIVVGCTGNGDSANTAAAPTTSPPAAELGPAAAVPMYDWGSPVDAGVLDEALIGLTPTDAQAKVAGSGWLLRVNKQDGAYLLVTADRKPNRINVAVEDGRITRVTHIG
jgi:hypothetical protein